MQEGKEKSFFKCDFDPGKAMGKYLHETAKKNVDYGKNVDHGKKNSTFKGKSELPPETFCYEPSDEKIRIHKYTDDYGISKILKKPGDYLVRDCSDDDTQVVIVWMDVTGMGRRDLYPMRSRIKECQHKNIFSEIKSAAEKHSAKLIQLKNPGRLEDESERFKVSDDQITKITKNEIITRRSEIAISVLKEMMSSKKSFFSRLPLEIVELMTIYNGDARKHTVEVEIGKESICTKIIIQQYRK